MIKATASCFSSARSGSMMFLSRTREDEKMQTAEILKSIETTEFCIFGCFNSFSKVFNDFIISSSLQDGSFIVILLFNTISHLLCLTFIQIPWLQYINARY